MDQETFLTLIRALNHGERGNVLRLVIHNFGSDAAVQTATQLWGKDDSDVYTAIFEAAGGHKEAEMILSSKWQPERILRARPVSYDFTFLIRLKNDGDDKYRLNCTVSLYEDFGMSTWFHQENSERVYANPEACIPWGELSAEDEALWTLLVSKIECLPQDYYIQSAKTCNDALLIPYDIPFHEFRMTP